MSNTALWIQAKPGDAEVSYAPAMDRQLFAVTFPAPGVIGRNDLAVSPRAEGANMSVDVAPGTAIVECDTTANGGSYLCAEPVKVNVPIPAAPSSGSRTHLIVMQARDPQGDAGSNYLSAPICVPDTGGGATLPNSAELLAKVTVIAGKAAVTADMIADARARAASPGQVLDRASWTSNTDSAAAVGAQAMIPNAVVTVTVSKPSRIVLAWDMFGRSVSDTPSGSSIEGSLFRSSSANAPTTSSPELAFYNRPFSEMGWVDISGTFADEITVPGTYSYGLSKVARTSKSYIWGSRPNTACQLVATFGGII